MRWIVETSLKFRFLVILLAASMVFFGTLQLRDSPVDVFPEFAPPLVEIQTPALGLSSSEVESLVTIPLENVLTGLPGLDELRSKSVPALSSIKLIFNADTDQLLARQLVQERLTTVVSNTIPSDVGPPVMLQPLSATSRVMKIGLSSDEMSVTEMSMIAYWTIRVRLLSVPGVANVAIWGERLQMLQVQVDPERLRAESVSLDQVMKATSTALDVGLLTYSDWGSSIGTGGWIETPNQRLGIRHILPIITPEDLAQVSLNGEDDRTLRLGDVANVVEDHQPLIGSAIINDGPGLLLIVEKLPWANTLDVTREVEEALEELKPGLQGIDIDSEIFRPATYIETSINNLGKALIIASILVILILFLFLFEWRVALISVIAIPLSLVAAGLILHFLDATINVMILAGLVIALGAVVDDAIIDVENIMRRLRQNRREGSNKSKARIILDASLEVRSAIIFATLIEVVVLIPVFFMEGLSGAFFKPLALAYVLAILASMVVALTVTPALSLMLLARAPLERQNSLLVRWLQAVYQPVVGWIIRTPRYAFAVVVFIVLLGVTVTPQLGQELLPPFKERDFLMHWLTKPGTSLPEMNRITIQASNELREIPGVRNFGAHIGQALIMDEVVGVYFGENWISVDSSVDYDQTVAVIQQTVDGYPGLVRDVQTYLKERIREVLTGSSEAVVVRIYGEDLDVLRSKAEEVRQHLDEIDGVVDLHVELLKEIPQLQVEVDLNAAESYGIKPGDVRRAAATLMSGQEVGDIFRNGKTFDVQVWSTPETRDSVNDLQKLLIDIPGGGHVRLDEVAVVRILPTPNAIHRINQKRRIHVEANVRGRDVGGVYHDIERAIQKVDFPHGYNPVLLGEFTERQAAGKDLQGIAIFAVIGVFFLLQTSFGSWRLATLSFLTLPMAMVGGALAVFLTSGIISLGSLVGFLTVMGIAVRNGIMMINHFQHLEQYEGETFGPELVLRGARERLAPILMTATTTALALVPLVIAGQIAGHEIEHPMAVVILGGLVTSTLLNLFVVPVLYLRLGRSSGLPIRVSTIAFP